MDRRDTLKTLLIGTVGGATIGTVGCKPGTTEPIDKSSTDLGGYGRTPSEKKHDQKVLADTFLNDHELETIAVLCDIILPATPTAASANEAEVPAFIKFIVKDLPSHQLPLRGGMMWLDTESNKRFNKVFKDASSAQQIEIIEDIAYPDPDGEKPEMGPGITFFDRMRNLTLTGYYTTKIGFDDLGYKGNNPNVWDGVPEEVLKDQSVDYDPEWIAKCVDQSKRDIVAEWDADGNLIT